MLAFTGVIFARTGMQFASSGLTDPAAERFQQCRFMASMGGISLLLGCGLTSKNAVVLKQEVWPKSEMKRKELPPTQVWSTVVFFPPTLRAYRVEGAGGGCALSDLPYSEATTFLPPPSLSSLFSVLGRFMPLDAFSSSLQVSDCGEFRFKSNVGPAALQQGVVPGPPHG